MTGEVRQGVVAAIMDPKIAGGVGVVTLTSPLFDWVPIVASGMGGVLSLVLTIIHIWKFVRWLKADKKGK